MVVVAKLKAIKGSEVQLEKALLAVVPKVSEEDGTLVYTLHRDLSDPAVFMFYEKYKDAEALTVHSSTSYFKELFKMVSPLLDSDPEISMYNELAGIDG